jgi:multidrug efflux pump subunit AcrA (membrane-fusion protein)
MTDRDDLGAPVASWLQLESAVERLHAAARAGLAARDFYRRLLAEAGAAVGSLGGAAWRRRADGTLDALCQWMPAGSEHSAIDRLDPARRREWIDSVLTSGSAEIYLTEADGHECLIAPVANPVRADDAAEMLPAVATFELWFVCGSSPLVQQGWLEFAATLADVAMDFHALDELRQLRASASLHRQAADYLRRLQSPRDLKGLAYEIANEGRRLLSCDRLSVLVKRGRRWRLLAASGASRVERRTEYAHRTERLADQVAKWGEPLSYPADDAEGELLPPSVTAVLEEHVDHSHARELACAPIAFRVSGPEEAETSSKRSSKSGFDAVLIAERFDSAAPAGWREQVVELGELCGPALSRAATLDRFPMRPLLKLSEAFSDAIQPGRLTRRMAVVGAIAAVIAALVFVPAGFHVESPATLHAAVEREVFATATGSISDIRVKHGQMVAKGDVLIVLNDPELSLKLQQVRGEIDAAQKRLEALAVTRTDRTLRENKGTEDRLPLAAEQRQLEERLASLQAQRTLLEQNHEALTLRSPIAGQVLTRDVDSLLASRPVERGQALLTVADTGSGWELVADVPQRQIGHVLHAQQTEATKDLAASLRLAGDVQQTYEGHVVQISSAAPLEPEGLENEAPPVKVRIALDGDVPPAARPGMTASVQVHCGKRSLGYVWLHDAGATLYRWLTF